MDVLRRTAACLASTAIAFFAVCTPQARADEDRADKDIAHTHYDGVSNDLLTAGLGKSGLGSAVAPSFADPLNPTVEELIANRRKIKHVLFDPDA